MPEEIWAAQTMLLPSIVAATFALAKDAKPETKLGALGCVLHCSFSYSLHMHRALVDNPPQRTFLFKFDACFIHVASLLTGMAWFLTIPWIEVIFHTGCATHIILSEPLRYPNQKNTIDILAGGGVLLSSFGLFYRSQTLWGWAQLFWVIGFIIHNRKLCGSHSATIFHALLAIPQFCVMTALQEFSSSAN